MIWVLVDLSYLAYRALHSVGGLATDDVPTGVMFGFFQQLRQICTDTRIASNRVAIFCDSRKSHRRKAYPAYKANRGKDHDPEQWKRISLMYDQLHLLRKKVLPAVGFPVFRQTGLESDDLIAQAARQLLKEAAFGGEARRGVMITADGDLYQCITDVVHWFDPQRSLYHNPSTFEQAAGIPAHRWGEVKQLAGCGTDNVKGVPGVGEATAIRYLNGNLPATYKRCEAIALHGRKILKRNKELVVLPHPRTKPVELVEPDYDPEAFFQFAKDYGLLKFLDEEKAWRSFFKGTFHVPRRRGEGRRPQGFGL